LQKGKSGIKSVAGQFGVSSRTLQRQLSDEGTSFHQVTEETKHRLCAELIQDPEIPVEEISRRLGYSNRSNFARAFREWFGTTPHRLRHAMRVGTAGRP
jgi:AraC-like DNA-binding protein